GTPLDLSQDKPQTLLRATDQIRSLSQPKNSARPPIPGKPARSSSLAREFTRSIHASVSLASRLTVLGKPTTSVRREQSPRPEAHLSKSKAECSTATDTPPRPWTPDPPLPGAHRPTLVGARKDQRLPPRHRRS